MAGRALRLSLILVALMIAGTAGMFLAPAPTADAGSWAAVCCGTGCGGDYCSGSGSFSCCKPLAK